MALVRSSRRSAVLLAVLALAGAIAIEAPAVARADGPATEAFVVPAQAPGFQKSVCDVVRSEGVGAAAVQLAGIAGGAVGTLLGQIALTVVKNHCEGLVDRTVRVVRSILATPEPPRVPAYSSLGTYLNQLIDRNANQIGSLLGGVSGQDVRNARAAVCTARDQDPAAVLARVFPNVRIGHLTGMNAFIRLVVDTCGGLNRADANYITGAVLNLALANEYQRDLDPPVVQIYRTGARRLGGGKAEVTAWFRTFDRGLRSCEIQLWYGGRWHQWTGQGRGCFSRSAIIATGQPYKWALRATDWSGHVSQWAVTYLATA